MRRVEGQPRVGEWGARRVAAVAAVAGVLATGPTACSFRFDGGAEPAFGAVAVPPAGSKMKVGQGDDLCSDSQGTKGVPVAALVPDPEEFTDLASRLGGYGNGNGEPSVWIRHDTEGEPTCIAVEDDKDEDGGPNRTVVRYANRTIGIAYAKDGVWQTGLTTTDANSVFASALEAAAFEE